MKVNQRIPDTSCKAFSLGELLVAVVIISLLVSLLGAGFIWMTGESRSMKCLMNMKQVSQVFFRYTMENNGDLVPAVILLPPSYTSGQTWMVHLDEKGYLPRESYDGKKNAIMTCPARGMPGSYTYNKTHYAVNRNVGFDNIVKKGSPFHKASRVAMLSQTMLIGESEGDYMIQSHSNVFLEYENRQKRKIAFPHRERANVIFMDGHAEQLPGPWDIPKKGASAPFYGS